MNLSPAQQRAIAEAGGPTAGSGFSLLTLAILAGVAYGGYRVYKHFRKG